MKRSTSARMKAVLALVGLCGGGSLFTSCHGIWRDAILQGTERFVLSLIDPTAIIDQLDEQDGSDQ